ncbi:hypothetical protein CD32_00140 [Lysinibacillus odysseyi 34hs-1 = NBRC 100172]|uniref:Uncharacterized protein n=1 Tax=Lysinibacillus odysseyi 34hs-1 = NBRC 100172 TaxID=1220589 RepID=A0A0A3IYE4_9BACI|nr:hypothetical protein CD32_00140 [Lysinibacillus odysseyi 34hs-1 = NBRC 100172]
MLMNLYSAMPLPMQRTIRPDSVLHDKLTTIVFTTQFDYDYVHLYEKCKDVYKYVRTIKLKES